MYKMTLTERMFVLSFRLAWFLITTTYGLGVYCTVVLKDPRLLETVSVQLIITVLGCIIMKIVANIFEHNNGGIFGTSDKQGGSNNGNS